MDHLKARGQLLNKRARWYLQCARLHPVHILKMYSWLCTRRAQRRFETGYTQVVLPGGDHEKRLREKSRRYAYWKADATLEGFSVALRRGLAPDETPARTSL